MAAPDNELDPTRVLPASLPTVITAHVHALGELGLTDLAQIADVIKDDPLQQLKFAAALAIIGEAVDLDKLDTVMHPPLSVVEGLPETGETSEEPELDQPAASTPALPAIPEQAPHDHRVPEARGAATPPGFTPLKSMFEEVFPDDAGITRLQGLSPAGKARFSQVVEEVYARNAKIAKYAPRQARRAALFMDGHNISETAALAGEKANAISQALPSVRGILGREARTLRLALEECERLVSEESAAMVPPESEQTASVPTVSTEADEPPAQPVPPVLPAKSVANTPPPPAADPAPDKIPQRLEDWGDQIFDMCTPHWNDDDVDSLLSLLLGETGEATDKARAHIRSLLDRYAPYRPGSGMQNMAKLTGVEWSAWRRLADDSSQLSLGQVREKYAPQFARLGGGFGSSMAAGLRKLVEAERSEQEAIRPTESPEHERLFLDDVVIAELETATTPEVEAPVQPTIDEPDTVAPEAVIDLREASMLPEPAAEADRDAVPEPSDAVHVESLPPQPVDLSTLPDPLTIGREKAMNPGQIASLFGITEKQLRRGIERRTAQHAFYGKTTPVTRGDGTGRRTAHYWGSGLQEVFEEARRIAEAS